MPTPNARLFEVDLVKALCIPAVVAIHSVRPVWDPAASVVELRIADAAAFAVPGFVAASGYLHARADAATPLVTWKRLRRVLIPYLIASFAAQLYWLAASGRPLALETVLEELALASSFGPYYYVQIAVLCILAAPLVQRLSPRALVFAAYVAVLVQAFDWMAIDLPFFWAVRDPLHWLGFYVGGWWVTRTLPPATLARLTGRRVWLAGIGAAVLLAALVLGPVGKLRPGWLRLVSAWCALLVLFVSSVGRSTDSRLIRHLSDSTYAIYLYHLFFVYPIQPFFRALPGIFEPEAVLVPWLAGVVGPLLLVAAGRALFGERSRTWLGA